MAAESLVSPLYFITFGSSVVFFSVLPLSLKNLDFPEKEDINEHYNTVADYLLMLLSSSFTVVFFTYKRQDCV